jgi:hypothetical protein
MSGNWLHNIKHVNPGEPVQAGIVGRPDRALADRTDYLKDRLDASSVGQALFDSGATIAPDVLPGHPVYWNYTSHRYEKALAAAAIDATTQLLTIQPSSDCVGLCLRKRSETLGDIVLRGVVEIAELGNAVTTPLLEDNVTHAPIPAGRYYLSAAEPGKLVQQKPGVTVSVCYVQGPKDNCSDVPRVVVMPHTGDFISEHTHYRFDLVPAPAGQHDPDAAVNTNRHQITSPNPALPGWLPANHASFNGKAPVGAWFGYNLAQHPALANVWPPVPIQSVALLWDKGVNRVGATEVPQGVEGLVVCDLNGIWWMSNCYGDVPWPATIDTANPQTPPDATTGECPRVEAMRVVVVFLRMLVGNDRSVVTSLQPDTDSPITVTNCAGAPAMTGDLALNLNLPVVPEEAIGGQVFKELVSGRKLKRGWVSDGVFTLSNQLSIAGSRNLSARTVTITLANPGVFTAANHGLTANAPVRFKTAGILPGGVLANKTYYVLSAGLTTNTFCVADAPAGTAVITTGPQAGPHTVETIRLLTNAEKTGFNIPLSQEVLVQQGVVKIDYTDNLVEREIAPQIIRLDDTVERLYLDIPYIGFPSGQASAIRVRFNVAHANLGSNLNMKVRVHFFGRGGTPTQAATLPSLLMTYRRIQAPATNGTALPVSDTAIGFTSNVTLPSDTAVVRDSEAFDVAAGDTVLVTLLRANNPADVYAEVGLLRIDGIVYNVT